MTAPRSNDNTSKRRNAPCPNSILDRKAFETALEDSNIHIRKVHMDAFYQMLHRFHYPELEVFVENYYKNELKLPSPPTSSLPLKNAVSNKKNRNPMQLPKVLLEFLKDPKNGFTTLTSTIDCARTSADGTTTKLAVRLHDGHVVESVLMRYVSRDGSRASLCVSSQVGCAMGCTFCATGTMGIRGNLTTGEILEQIVHADRILAQETVLATQQQQKENGVKTKKTKLDLVRNVVFMGMGEPLNNYDNVVEACRALIDCKRWNLGYSKVTVSTVGVTPRIRALTRDLPEISLALSLHAPNQELRSKIVPAAKAYKIEGLIDALDAHMMWYRDKHYDGARYTEAERVKESTRRRAMIEYVMLEGETSTFECAHQLGKLCENRHLVVNLIPYNQTDVKDKLNCPSEEHMKEFQRIVSSYGAFCTIRRTMGADIASACGQLVVEKEKENVDPADIEDGPFDKKKKSTRAAARAAATDPGVKASRSKAAAAAAAPHSASKKPVSSRRQQSSIDKDLSSWIMPLSIATGVAAACFVASSVLFVVQRRKR